MSQVITSDQGRVLAWLLDGQRRIVAVDGAHGSGKSSLASWLAGRSGMAHVNLDDHLNRGLKGYLHFLRYDEIKRRANELLASRNAVIMDGLCVLAMLQRLGMPHDGLIYVKRLSENGVWGDEDFCLEEAPDYPISSPGSDLEQEVHDYHRTFMPITAADVVFERIERPGFGIPERNA